MPILVVIACIYGKGCDEAAHSMYQYDPQFRSEIQYAESKTENVVGKQATAAIATSGLFLAGNAWTYKLTDKLLVNGQNRFGTLGLSYQLNF